MVSVKQGVLLAAGRTALGATPAAADAGADAPGDRGREEVLMETGKVGDRVVIESEQVGHPGRDGEVLEVLGTSDMVHYRVRWEDGHESTFFPEMGSVKFITPAKAPARR